MLYKYCESPKVCGLKQSGNMFLILTFAVVLRCGLCWRFRYSLHLRSYNISVTKQVWIRRYPSRDGSYFATWRYSHFPRWGWHPKPSEESYWRHEMGDKNYGSRRRPPSTWEDTNCCQTILGRQQWEQYSCWWINHDIVWEVSTITSCWKFICPGCDKKISIPQKFLFKLIHELCHCWCNALTNFILDSVLGYKSGENGKNKALLSQLIKQRTYNVGSNKQRTYNGGSNKQLVYSFVFDCVQGGYFCCFNALKGFFL